MAVRPHSVALRPPAPQKTTAQGFNLVVNFNTLNLSLLNSLLKVDADATSPDVGLDSVLTAISSTPESL